MEQTSGRPQPLRPVLKVVAAAFTALLVIRAIGTMVGWAAVGAPISRTTVLVGAVVQLLILGAALAGMAALATWQVRARRNAVLISPFPHRHSPVMAGWSWFIPFANAVLPARVLSDLWRAADPATRGDRARAAGGDPVTRWWATMIVFAIVMALADVALTGAGRVYYSEQAYRAAMTRSAFGNTMLLIGWTVLFVRGYRLLERITTWQETAAAAPAPVHQA